MHQLALRLIAKAKQSNDPLDEPLRALTGGTRRMSWAIQKWKPCWRRSTAGTRSSQSNVQRPTTEQQNDGIVFGIDREGNPHHGPQVDGYPRLKSDGSTASGGWIYSGVLGPDKINKANSRNSKDYLGHGWGFVWPGDRRIIYNRASASPTGEPWSDRKKLIWWDRAQSKWTGIDNPDFPLDKSPEFRPTGNESGLDGIPGDAAFILHEDGLGWLYVASGLQDGPIPTHYEPLESPVHNALYSRDTNPAVHWFTRQENRFAPPGDPRFPFVLTTYRLTEHHTAGGMSRFLSHLAELQPELFAEMSPELARELKIDNGDHISVVSLRGAIEARALVSRRMRPMQLNGKTVHQIAMPFHFGSAGPVRGGATNDLIPISGEPNVTIMEAKACCVNIVPGRLPRGPAFEDWLNQYVPKDGPPNLHPEQPAAGCALRQSRWWSRLGRKDRQSMIGEGIHSTNQSKHSYVQDHVEVGFFTDPSVCIGCKACEVACKEWNEVPDDGFTWTGNSYDNTGHLGASTWRHVMFLEQDRAKGNQIAGPMSLDQDPFRWVFLSDVCKHCEEAGCLEACPTGSIVRTEVGSVLVQNDVCNGCGYCVVSCPFGVIDRRPSPLPDAGGAFKCTFCYDRQKSGLVPACAKVCPTESIVFGRLDDLRAQGAKRVQQLQEAGYTDAQLYDPQETSVRGIHAFFLILGEPEAYGLPPKPQVPTIYLKSAWTAAFATAIASIIATLVAFAFSS